jgi:nucleotide-binding universal stress UspA family protein
MGAAAIRRIVVGVDGSDHAARALEIASGLAKQIDAEVIGVHALEPALYAPPAVGVPAAAPPMLDESLQAEMKRELDEKWSLPARKTGVRFRAVLDAGPPAQVLKKWATQTDAGLVVVGRRGRSGLAEALLGSTSHDLIHDCDRPVLVVPPERPA